MLCAVRVPAHRFLGCSSHAYRRSRKDGNHGSVRCTHLARLLTTLCHSIYWVAPVLCCLQMMEASNQDEDRVTEDAKLFVGNLSWSTTDEVSGSRNAEVIQFWAGGMLLVSVEMNLCARLHVSDSPVLSVSLWLSFLVCFVLRYIRAWAWPLRTSALSWTHVL